MSITATRKKPPEVGRLPRRAIERGKAIAARYQITVWREDGEWYGQCVEEPGAMGDGKTIAQCVRNTRYAGALAAASRIADGEPTITPIIDQERRRKAG